MDKTGRICGEFKNHELAPGVCETDWRDREIAELTTALENERRIRKAQDEELRDWRTGFRTLESED